MNTEPKSLEVLAEKLFDLEWENKQLRLELGKVAAALGAGKSIIDICTCCRNKEGKKNTAAEMFYIALEDLSGGSAIQKEK